MTAFDLLFLLGWGAITLCGSVLGARFGAAGGAVLGAVAAALAPVVLVKSLSALWRVTSGHRPDRPPCIRGRCDSAQYRWLPSNSGGLLECACGDRYQFDTPLLGRVRFSRIMENAEAVPYMFYRPWRPWSPWKADPNHAGRSIYRG